MDKELERWSHNTWSGDKRIGGEIVGANQWVAPWDRKTTQGRMVPVWAGRAPIQMPASDSAMVQSPNAHLLRIIEALLK